MFGFEQFNLNFGDTIAEVDASTVNIDTAQFIVHTWTCTQNATVNFSGTGAIVLLTPTCDGTSRTLTWGTGIHSAASSYALTINKKHSLLFMYDGTEHVLVSTDVLS